MKEKPTMDLRFMQIVGKHRRTTTVLQQRFICEQDGTHGMEVTEIWKNVPVLIKKPEMENYSIGGEVMRVIT